MTISLQVPDKQSFKPTITVMGVGGAGGNAVNNMINSGLSGVKFVVANTDAQSIDESICDNDIQLGQSITSGLGAGSYPEVGRASAEESAGEILDQLQGSNMVFVTAGLGGGTGTGAAPVVARLAKEQGILTVAVVTKPFHFEGTHRMRVAELGLQELQKYVDTLIVIPNQNLFRIADKSTTFLDAFRLADEVLHSGVRGITDLMVVPGLINLDFSDVRSVMSEMGKAMMGTGEGNGDNRAVEAAEAAIANPLLDNVSMKGARGVLINITGGADMTLFEVDEAANRIREEVEQDANIIFGSAFNRDLEGVIRVSVVATGIDIASDKESVGAQSAAGAFSFGQSKSETDDTSSSSLFGSEEGESDDSSNAMTLDDFIDGEDGQDGGDEQLDLGAVSSSLQEDEFAAEAAPSVEGAFIAPEPVSPKSTDGFTAGNSASPSSSKNLESAEHNRASGLFGMFNKKEQGSAPVIDEKPAVDNSSASGGSSSSDENLDIPAFLRRNS